MKRWYLFSGILAALLGLLVIIFPSFWIKLVVVIIGLAAIAYGIYSLKFTKAISEDIGYRRTILIKSIVSTIMTGIISLFRKEKRASAFCTGLFTEILPSILLHYVYPPL